MAIETVPLVVIGDPAHPDLVADWIELRATVGLSGVGVSAIRAGHVERTLLKVRHAPPESPSWPEYWPP